MSTLYLEWQDDLMLNQSGGLAWATGWDEARQSIEREWLTTPEQVRADGTVIDGDYVYEPHFGLGLRALLGGALTLQLTQSILKAVTAALAKNSSIARNPAPVVAVVPGNQSFSLYVDVALADGTPGTLAIGPQS